MATVAERLTRITDTLPQGVSLVAVSKFHPATAVLEAYEAGQRMFGESRANELVAKASSLPTDIEWHFIGHLQTNKVRQILPHVSLIQSVDSERLLHLINSEALRISRIVDILLQVHVAQEETKFGFTPHEFHQLLDTVDFSSLKGIRLRGVMGMASNVDDIDIIASDFRHIAQCYDKACQLFGSDCNILSMGMSHDYHTAIANGANMVRVGSYIFGERSY